jgi:hypothetical protein
MVIGGCWNAEEGTRCENLSPMSRDRGAVSAYMLFSIGVWGGSGEPFQPHLRNTSFCSAKLDVENLQYLD